MTQHFPLDYGDVVHQGFFDPIQELLGASLPSLRIEVGNSSTLTISAGTGNDQVTAALTNSTGTVAGFRWITSSINATLPGALTNGTGSVYITASDNDFSGSVSAPDAGTDYSFAMEIKASGTPTTDLWRKVGEVDVSGGAITAFRPMGGPRVTSEFTLAARPDTATQPGLLITGRASQSGDLIQVRDSSGTMIHSVSPAGNITGTGDLTIGGDLRLTGATQANLTLVSDGTGRMVLQTVDSGGIEPGLLPPVGSLMPYAGTTAPGGWLLCDGSAVSRSTYGNLFSVCGTAYGAGNGTSTFNLPNLKGRTLVGVDAAQTEFDTRGETGGAKEHTLTSAQLPSHTHSFSATSDSQGAHSHSASGTTGASGTHTHASGTLAASSSSHSHTASSSTAGSHEHSYNDNFANYVSYGNNFTRQGSSSGVTDVGISGLINTTTGTSGSHSHTITVSGGDHSHTVSGSTGSGGDHSHSFSGSTDSGGAHTHSVSGTTGALGSGVSHNNLQPYLAINYIIKT